MLPCSVTCCGPRAHMPRPFGLAKENSASPILVMVYPSQCRLLNLCHDFATRIDPKKHVALFCSSLGPGLAQRLCTCEAVDNGQSCDNPRRSMYQLAYAVNCRLLIAHNARLCPTQFYCHGSLLLGPKTAHEQVSVGRPVVHNSPPLQCLLSVLQISSIVFYSADYYIWAAALVTHTTLW